MGAAAPEVSIVLPAHNEAGNIAPLVEEIAAALTGRWTFEIVYVNDGSTDGTEAELARLAAERPWLRQVKHAASCGQSAAIRTGVAHARAPVIVTLDGDGQNDPADLPRLLAERDKSRPELKLFAGWRVNRQDTGSKRWASKWANAIRSRMLGDATPDTGCGTKLFERDAFLELPHFNHMHRYLPALMQRAGWKTVSVPVNHRPRGTGVSKYNNLQRAWVGLTDLRGVSWLIKRSKVTGVEEAERP